MTVLIVDDEPLIHISIEKLLLHCHENLTVLHAYNGKEMLEYLSSSAVSLAYVDIKMPGISGLEAIQEGKKLSPFTRYYIMTGFDEFEYAKQAVKLKVDDYLMKPLDFHTIQETLYTAMALNAQKQEQQKNVFRNWLESALNGRFGYLGEYSSYFCSLILLTLDSPADTDGKLNSLLTSNQHMVSILFGNKLFLLIFSPKSSEVHDRLLQFSNADYPDGITCFAVPVTSNMTELSSLLPVMEQYSSIRVLLGTGRFYWLAPLLSCSAQELSFCNTCMEWQAAFLKRDYTKFSSASASLCRQYSSVSALPEQSRAFLHFLQLTVGFSFSAESLEKQFSQAGELLLESSKPDSRAKTIIQFIQEHYREELSISDLSSRFGLSVSYISSLLKQTLGIRYNDYVTQLRISYAKELLLTTHKSIKEITSSCGYYSQSHFTKLFLEHEHCTPLEYRKSKTGNS